MKRSLYNPGRNSVKMGGFCIQVCKKRGSTFKRQDLNPYRFAFSVPWVEGGFFSQAYAHVGVRALAAKNSTHVEASGKRKPKQPSGSTQSGGKRLGQAPKRQTSQTQAPTSSKTSNVDVSNQNINVESTANLLADKDSVVWPPFTGLTLTPDPIYEHALVSMLVQRVMKHGKKQKAYKLTYATLERLHQKTQQDPVETLVQAVENVRPALEVKPRRVGGSTYQVPYEVKPERGTVLALRWILNAVRQRKGVNMVEKLQVEIYNASKGSGSAMKRRDDEHRSAESNRAFIRYRVGADQRKKSGAKPAFGRGHSSKAKRS